MIKLRQHQNKQTARGIKYINDKELAKLTGSLQYIASSFSFVISKQFCQYIIVESFCWKQEIKTGVLTAN